jgi:hypothetical protein
MVLPNIEFQTNNPIGEIKKRVEISDTTMLPLEYARYQFQWFVSNIKLFEDKREPLATQGFGVEYISNDTFITDLTNNFIRSIIGSKVLTFIPAKPSGSPLYEIKNKVVTLPDFIYNSTMKTVDVNYQDYMFIMSMFGRVYDIELFQRKIMVASSYYRYLKLFIDDLYQSLKDSVSLGQLDSLSQILVGQTKLQKIEFMLAKNFLEELTTVLSNRELYIGVIILRGLFKDDLALRKFRAESKRNQRKSSSMISGGLHLSTVEQDIQANQSQMDEEKIRAFNSIDKSKDNVDSSTGDLNVDNLNLDLDKETKSDLE